MKGYNYHIPPRPPPSHHDDIFVSISWSQPHSTWWWWWDVRIRQLVWTRACIIFVLVLDVECRDSHNNLQKIATECQISLSLDVDSDSLVIRAKTHLHSIDQSSSIFYPPNQPSTSQDPVSIVQHWSGAYLWYRSNTKTIWPKSAWSRRLRSHPRIISAPSSRPRTEHCLGFDLRTGLFHDKMTHSKTLKKLCHICIKQWFFCFNDRVVTLVRCSLSGGSRSDGNNSLLFISIFTGNPALKSPMQYCQS